MPGPFTCDKFCNHYAAGCLECGTLSRAYSYLGWKHLGSVEHLGVKVTKVTDKGQEFFGL